MPGTSLKACALILVIIVILVHYYCEHNIHIENDDDDDDEVVQHSGLTQQAEEVSAILYVSHFVLIQLSVISTVGQNKILPQNLTIWGIDCKCI